MTLAEKLRARSKAWAELHEVATHIGVFPLDCCMIDSRLESAAADEIERLQRQVAEEIQGAARAVEEERWKEKQGDKYGSY